MVDTKIDFTLKTFIGLLRQAVMFYPKQETNRECLRPSTFIMLEKHTQLNASNLGITKRHIDKDYYFSRTKLSTYPIVTGWLQSKKYNNLFTKANNAKPEECFRFELLVLDQYVDDCKNCTYCQKRTIHDIYCDTSEIMKNVLSFFKNVVFAETVKDGVTTCIWANSQILNQMVTAGDIDSWKANDKKTNILHQSLFANATSLNSQLYDHFTLNSLYGEGIVFEFCTKLCPPCDFEFEKRLYSDFVLNCCG